MNQPRNRLYQPIKRTMAGALACASWACAATTPPPAKAGAPTAAVAKPPLDAEHQQVVDRLSDEAKDFCRVSGREAKILQVGTTDLSHDPESRHVVYECVEPPGTAADEAEADAPEAFDASNPGADR